MSISFFLLVLKTSQSHKIKNCTRETEKISQRLVLRFTNTFWKFEKCFCYLIVNHIIEVLTNGLLFFGEDISFSVWSSCRKSIHWNNFTKNKQIKYGTSILGKYYCLYESMWTKIFSLRTRNNRNEDEHEVIIQMKENILSKANNNTLYFCFNCCLFGV